MRDFRNFLLNCGNEPKMDYKFANKNITKNLQLYII